MAGRSTEEVRRELESERQRLGDAVRTMRTKAGAARRKLPFVAVGAAGASLVLRAASRRVFRRKPSGTKKRARFSFLDSGD
jgi:hypothetical protein